MWDQPPRLPLGPGLPWGPCLLSCLNQGRLRGWMWELLPSPLSPVEDCKRVIDGGSLIRPNGGKEQTPQTPPWDLWPLPPADSPLSSPPFPFFLPSPSLSLEMKLSYKELQLVFCLPDKKGLPVINFENKKNKAFLWIVEIPCGQADSLKVTQRGGCDCKACGRQGGEAAGSQRRQRTGRQPRNRESGPGAGPRCQQHEWGPTRMFIYSRWVTSDQWQLLSERQCSLLQIRNQILPTTGDRQRRQRSGSRLTGEHIPDGTGQSGLPAGRTGGPMGALFSSEKNKPDISKYNLPVFKCGD